jgi:hypothetical protein
VYNAVEQSGAEYLNNFRDLGVSSFRVEFLEETPEQVKRSSACTAVHSAVRSPVLRFGKA